MSHCYVMITSLRHPLKFPLYQNKRKHILTCAAGPFFIRMWSFSAKPSALSARTPSATRRRGALGSDGLIASGRVSRGFCERRTSCKANWVDGNDVSAFSGLNVSNGSWMGINEPPVWKGDENAFMRAAASLELPPAVKLLLLSDGSMTKHVSLLMMEEVTVEPLGKPQVVDWNNIPELCKRLLEGPILQREVFLKTKSSETLIYAASWWNRETLDSFFGSWNEPVGSQILSRRIETHREIDQLYLGESMELSLALGEKGPFWGRLYVLWSGGKPMCIIHEVLSHRLFERAAMPSHIQRLEIMNGKGFNGSGANNIAPSGS